MMLEWFEFIVTKIAEWFIPFLLGLLLRKRFGRFIIKKKKWLFNDAVNINILSVRLYNPVETHNFNQDVYEDVKAKITSQKLHDIFPDGMRIEIPTFGILKLSLSKISEEETIENQEEIVESIKVTLQPVSPVRLGIRDIKLLNDYAQSAEILFNAVEKLFVAYSAPQQNYTILESPRFGHFVEEKTLEIDDEELGIQVHATQSKVTIVVSPTSQIVKAANKYLLV